MPTVVIEGRFRFVINTRENRFESPHVHVWVDNQDTCRINLLSGAFIERPPPRHLPRHHGGIQEEFPGNKGNLGNHPRGVNDEHRQGCERGPDDDRRQAG